MLIVDDSAVTRRLLSAALRGDPEIQVVAEAADPFTARSLIAKHRPDVVTLDVEMPQMDGITFLRHLMKHQPLPVVIVSSHTPHGSAAGIEALRAGALDVIPKPLNPAAIAPFETRLRQRIRELGRWPLRPRPATDHGARIVAATDFPLNAIIAIGASTGGPQAIEDLLSRLPADMPPIVITQHMPADFTRLFAKRLSETCGMRVVEAADRQELVRSIAYVAPGDYHLTVEQQGGRLLAAVRRGAPVNQHRPSVDVLFRSLASLRGVPVVGILLTGMGSDGADGLVELYQAGHQTIAEDEQSCVVFGMPREAVRRGGAKHVLPLQQIPGMMIECLSRLHNRPKEMNART
ncbi:MAG TPA: chemotaxis response regulator protein-glutamate methylesterase [Vicinamibacterales bacterium]|nr:chemotaxis response regulator protein-glutamate methylesterase [Vicinamibacterales bacterium]